MTEPGGPEPRRNLEADLHRLQEIVGRLEGKEVELEEAIALFEEGIALVRDAERWLAQAEGRLRQFAEAQTGPRPEGSGPGGAR